MTKLGLATKVRAATKQSSTSLTDADLLLLANDAKNELAVRIAERDIKGNYFIVPSLLTLTANQREYPWDAGVLSHIYSLEIAFSSTAPLAYVLATPDDFRRHGIGRTEANIQAKYNNVLPRYEIQRRAFYLLSGAIDATTLGASTIASGIRIRERIFPADLATNMTENTIDLAVDPTLDSNSVGTTFGMPKQFHELWARRMSMDWKSQHPGAVPLSLLEQKYEQDLEKALSAIEQNDLSGEIIATIYNPGNNGYDY